MLSRANGLSEDNIESLRLIDEDGDEKYYEQMDIPSLERLVEQYQHTLEAEISARNAAQVEYDAVMSYFDVAEKNIIDEELQIRALSLQMEARQEEQAMEMEVYGSKVKHLEYSHCVKLDDESNVNDQYRRDVKSLHLINETEADKDLECFREEFEERQLCNKIQAQKLEEKCHDEVNALKVFLGSELDIYKRQCSRYCDELYEELSIKNTVDSRIFDEKLHHFIFELERLHQLEINDIYAHYEPLFTDHSREINNVEMIIEDLRIQILNNNMMIEKLIQENEVLTIQYKAITDRVRVRF
jgi:hypothetical protein